MVKIITTNSYFNFFPKLCELLKLCPTDLEHNNFVFLEEKISLMAERAIADALNGSFNTSVYSFGNYYKTHSKNTSAVSKEGSSMIVRKILSTLSLKTFKNAGQTLAPSLFELIIQLKSASVSPSSLLTASKNVKGILKNKITDVYEVYNAYENYLLERGLTDQSAQLDRLPEIIEKDVKMKGANVFVVGFQGFTAQIKNAIKSLIKTARSVTFILPDGKNKFAFVGETKNAVISMCNSLGEKYTLEELGSEYPYEAQFIVDNLFAPTAKGKDKIKTDKIFTFGALSFDEQARKIASEIRELVVKNGVRYREITVATSEIGLKEALKKEFIKSEIPCSLDDRKTAHHHPLIRLILSYVEVFRKNKERGALLNFITNPLFSNDKDLNDGFANYVYKYNINYSGFTKPFTYEIEEESTKSYEELRKKAIDVFKTFNPDTLLETLNVKDKLDAFTSELLLLNTIEASSVNEQIYKYVTNILLEIKAIFGGYGSSYKEFKEIFTSGVSALKISILPRLNDAVFVGDFKECAMAKADYLFLAGLDHNVPNVKADVALLSDKDITALKDVSLLIEPKIKIVNHRAREQTLLGVSAFNKRLYVIYTLLTKSGAKSSLCEVVNFIADNFTTIKLKEDYEYSSIKSGLRDFAIRCSEFAYGSAIEMGSATAFYELNKELCEKIVNYSNKDVVIRLDNNQNLLVSKVVSPTSIEEYYSCPYKFFISRALKVKMREEGIFNALNVGNVMHEIFSSVILKMDEISGEEEIPALVEKERQKILENPVYAKHLNDSKTEYDFNEAVKESHSYLTKMYRLHKNSLFKSGGGGTEVSFGKYGDYPEIPLIGGKVNLSGKIDRVDTYGDYFRIIDYKTGKADASNKGLYSGTKLQLYLYALAIKNKKLAGAYYMPIKSGFKKENETLFIGKSLDNQEILTAQDKAVFSGSEFLPSPEKKNLSSQENLTALLEYSKIISEKAVLLMEEGFIFPTPYEGACEYCEYKAFCPNKDVKARKVKAVKESDILSATKTEANNE